MYLLRPPAIIVAFLIVAVSIPQPLFSQTAPKPSQPKQSQQRPQTERPQRADALAPEIKKLLEASPLAPKSPDEKATDGNAPEDEKKPPADDAPIKELVAYWSGHCGEAPQWVSNKVRRRLLEACEDRPELLRFLTDCLPENTDTHDRLYKRLNEEYEEAERWKHPVQEWLRRNSSYFRDELIKGALAADDDSPEDLYALARLDWNAARPILETLASSGKARVKTVALALLYEHAAQDGDSARTESYRSILKAIVENRQAIWPARMESLKSLMGSEWSGQEAWFISLFADPTLGGFRGYEIGGAAESKDDSSVKANATKSDVVEVTGPAVVLDTRGILDVVLLQNPDRWLPVISNLVGHDHRTVHNTAVKCLVEFLTSKSINEKEKKEIAQTLMPWLTEPDWAAKEIRDRFIRSLAYLNMPELTPGLTWVLDNDENPDNRAYAARALAQYRDPRSIPALRRALEIEWGLEKKECEDNCGSIIITLIECGGFSDDEMAAAVEAYARDAPLADGEQKSMAASAATSLKPPLPNVRIGLSFFVLSFGRIPNKSKPIQATEGLAVRLIGRAKALWTTEPVVARKILRIIEAAPLRAAEVNLVERIGEGWADFDSITLALRNRDTLMKSAGDELYGLIKEGGHAAGLAASILADEREWKAILENGDAKAQLALLACARYLRDKLPVELVVGPLNSPNRGLAEAAESYLEIEDSAEARKLVLARHPDETYIVGDLTAVSSYDGCIEAARKGEDALRKEVRGPNGPDAIYAVTQRDSGGDLSGVIIRVRGGKAEMSVYETQGRRNVRRLTDSEFDELKNFTSRQEVEELGPESYSVDGVDVAGLSNYEYLRLTRESGRRIALNDLHRAPKNPTPHEELSGLFYRLSKSGEFTARYDVEDKIPGVEVVFADKNRSARKVCAEGGEIRALIEEKGAKYMQGGAKGSPEWLEFSSGKPGEARDEPSACHELNLPSSAPKNAAVIRRNPFGRPAQSDGTRFHVTRGEDEGIWKAETGKEPVKILSGSYREPVITPDGKWLVATKYVDGDKRLIRRNLQSGEEFVISLPQVIYILKLVYIAAHGKVLADVYWHGAWGNKCYLIDPETGTVQSVKGEFRPLLDDLSRTLQSAGAPNLFWAAIYDWKKRTTTFGRYDSKKFAFAPLLDFPGLELGIADIWVDAAGGKIWFVYEGQLLRLPIPSQTK